MEKLANRIALQSIVEGGMEKQALDTARLLQMGRNFALRGNLDRFNELLRIRSKIAGSKGILKKRKAAYEKAKYEHDLLEGYILPSEVNPASKKLRTAKLRIPENSVDIYPWEWFDRYKMNDAIREAMKPSSSRLVTIQRPPMYDPHQLSAFGKALRHAYPGYHEKALTTGSFFGK
jgi:hypothetical protein